MRPTTDDTIEDARRKADQLEKMKMKRSFLCFGRRKVDQNLRDAEEGRKGKHKDADLSMRTTSEFVINFGDERHGDKDKEFGMVDQYRWAVLYENQRG